ncbi:cation:proton antiporter [Chloroflexota bacterium]
MTEELTLITDFAAIMIVAALVLVVFRRLNQPPVLGYIAAGLIVGPYTLPTPIVHDVETIRLLADLGLILVMFGIGLEFSWSKIRQVGFHALVAGAFEIALMFVLGYSIGKGLGWTLLDSAFLGAALSISSSVIIVKLLRDSGRTHLMSSRIIVGILVVEDFAAVTFLALLSGVSTSGNFDLASAGILVVKLVLFAVGSLALGGWLVPRIIDMAYRLRSKEMLLLVSLGLCFSLALLSDWLGLSVAAGAFLMGAVVAESKHADDIENTFRPVGDMFAAIFFVSIGMLIDVRLIQQFIVPALIVAGVFIVGKVVADSLGTFISGAGGRTSLRVGTGMPQMGEFSLTFAKVGRDSGAVNAILYPVIVLAASITTIASPYIVRYSERVIDWLEKITPQTLKDYLGQVDRWLKSMRRSTKGEGERAAIMRRYVRNIMVNVMIIAVFFGIGTLALQFVEQLAEFLRIRAEFIGMIVGFIVLLVSFPSLVAAWRNMRHLAASAVMRTSSRGRSGGRWRRGMARSLLLDSISVVLLLVLLVVSLPFVMGLLNLQSFALVVPLLMLAVVAYFLFGSIRRIHSRVEDMFCRTFTGDEGACSVDVPEESSSKSKATVKEKRT